MQLKRALRQRGTRSSGWGLALLSALAILSSGAEIVSVDVSEWPSANETVTASGWTVRGISAYKEDGGVTFDAVGDYAISPIYPGCVTQLVLRVCSTRPDLVRNLKATPVTADVSARQWTMACTAEPKYVEQSFSWQPAEDVRQFRFQIEGSSNGNWRVGALYVHVDRVEAPHALTSDVRYSDALTVGWDPEARAVRQEVEIDRVDVTPSRYDALLRKWDFTSLTNNTGNTKDFSLLDPPESLWDVGGTNLNLQGWAGGHLQVGKRDDVGIMMLPLMAKVERTALVTMFRHYNDENDGDVPLFYVADSGETNVLANPVLTSRPTAYVFPLPDEAVSIVLQSRSKRRIRVEDVRIVTGYEGGFSTTNLVVLHRTVKCNHTEKGLVPGGYIWRVRSFDRGGTESAWSEFVHVTLDRRNPKRPIDGLAVIIR